jgi:hypothetical protein
MARTEVAVRTKSVARAKSTVLAEIAIAVSVVAESEAWSMSGNAVAG